MIEFLLFIFFLLSHAGSSFPVQISNLHPLPWKHTLNHRTFQTFFSNISI